jgi:hypothetical protein
MRPPGAAKDCGCAALASLDMSSIVTLVAAVAVHLSAMDAVAAELQPPVLTPVEPRSQEASIALRPEEPSSATSKLSLVLALVTDGGATASTQLPTAPFTSVVIRPELAPDQSKYNPADPELRAAAAMLQVRLPRRLLPAIASQGNYV